MTVTIKSGVHNYLPNSIKTPTEFSGLRSYWDGRDITPGSGTANNWAPRGGSEQSTLVNIGSASTVATRNGMRGTIGRMQVASPGYTMVNGAILSFYVFEMPTLGVLRGCSSYLGKLLPLVFSYSGANRFEVARGTGGTGFETPVLLVSDVSSWIGKLVSIVVKTTTTSISAFWRVNGVAGEATVSLAATNIGPEGWTIGGFSDSGGEINTPFFATAVIDGGTDNDCRALANWGASVWK